MTKVFNIFGEIVADEVARFSYEDTTPAQVSSFLENLDEGDEVEFQISSPGGDTSACIAICNLIKNCNHKTTSKVLGLAASSASCIACACDELVLYKNSLLMIHLPWTGLIGNSEEMRKTADVLDQYGDALISVYRTKFSASDEQILEYMKNETWITGEFASQFGLKCTVLDDENEIKIAACAKIPQFKKAPEKFNNYIKGSNMPDEKNIEQPKDETVETVENRTEEMISVSECEKRVSGMQSTMAKQIDSLKKEHETIVNDLKVQIEAKDKELTQAKASVTSLNENLEKVTNELQNTVSALDEKTKALETLNANVNTTPEELPTFKEGLEKCKTPKEKVDFIKSGKYTK